MRKDELNDLADDEFHSISIALSVPTDDEDGKANAVVIYLPKVKFDSIDSNSDVDGVVGVSVNYSSEPATGADEECPVITFI
jgi:hypothetical protein